MNSYLEALKAVSGLDFSFEGNKSRRGTLPWKYVLMRGILGAIWSLAGIFVCWLLPQSRLLGGILGALVIVFLRTKICRGEERSGMSELAERFIPLGNSEIDANLKQIALNFMIVLRPICYVILLANSNWLWIAASTALSCAASLDFARGNEEKALGSHWSTAIAFALFAGIISSKCIAGLQSMFIMSIIGSIMLWLSPMLFKRLSLVRSFYGAMFASEAIALIIGILALGM